MSEENKHPPSEPAPPQGGYPQGGYPPPGGYPPQGGHPPPGAYPPGQPGYSQPGQPGYPPQGYAYNSQGQMVQGQYGYPQGQGQPPQMVGNTPYMPPQPGVPGGPQQPIQFMARPAAIPGVPPGLEYLSQIDQLLVHQQIEIFEMMTSWETCNRYQVKNSIGQQIYFAAEESDTCMRQCCGPSRGFVMHITDNMGQEVIRVNREFKCCAGWNCCAGMNCCAMEITVEAPVGEVIGSIKQECSFCAPTYGVYDKDGNRILGIEGPVCFCQAICCPTDIDFNISGGDGTNVGKISKQWTGYFKETFTQADNFGVNFPRDLDVRIKGTLLGAVFLIDFMYFEQKNNNSNK